jgi:hypothetical protein
MFILNHFYGYHKILLFFIFFIVVGFVKHNVSETGAVFVTWWEWRKVIIFFLNPLERAT